MIPVNPDERKTQTQVSIASGNNLSQEAIQVWAYPNPTTDQVHLKITGKVSNQVIKVIGYNLQGQVMINTAHRLSEKQLRVVTKDWPQGTYLLKVVINQQIKTIRIYKQ